MNNQQKIIVLWILLIIGMFLHPFFVLNKLFYGLPVARPGANGMIPEIVMYKRIGFYILPMIYVTVLLFTQAQWVRVLNFVISLIYTFINIQNFLKEFEKPQIDTVQIILLGFVATATLLLNFASWKWIKERNALLS
jgi:hypothetical protein